MQNVTCASVIVTAPLPCGQPITCSRATNSSSSDKPVMTSGITRGAVVMPASTARPRNAPNRASAIPDNVPRTTEEDAAMMAILIDSHAASRICSFDASSTYHLSVGECAASHTVTSLELLNENTIIERMGTYRKMRPATSAERE